MPILLVHPEEKSPISSGAIEIGILNNLSDGALASGEQQFMHLIAGAAEQVVIRIKLFSMPSIPRGAAAGVHIAQRYLPFSRLTQSRLDGLIVTGCEPKTDDLPQELFWSELAAVIDWAEHNTRSTIWSCLAAHAAVLHLDGVKRRRLDEKCSGLFRVERVAKHPLLKDMLDGLQIAHSRWNQIDRSELVAAGYEVFTASDIVGVDTFVKQWRSLFVYLQGHPEYDAGALAREYQRDVSRFFEGRSSRLPAPPSNYFQPSSYAALLDLTDRMRANCGAELHPIVPLPLLKRLPSSNHYASTLFRNWINYLMGCSSNEVIPEFSSP